MNARRIRIHGDYHLGQLLHTGKNFVILDFEGESLRPLGERRLKQSPLRDVAGMLRSLDYAAQAALLEQMELGRFEHPQRETLELWRRFWVDWAQAGFLKAYLAGVEGSGLLPPSGAHQKLLLEAYVLAKAAYEIGYELANRPAWVSIPVHGLLRMMEPVSAELATSAAKEVV
jgi:maltose alpha-D-glucosyltransferase/alpha-amylase